MVADRDYMARALALAARGRGWTAPNPLVGCVLVRDGRVIGEGWHTRFGAPHAEREALAACATAGEDPVGATAYVTLEPCGHTGKQPPCADALVEAGLARVVVGSSDPNPLVSGKGIRRLREAGIQVDEGMMREECDALNRAFFHHVRTGLPYVTAKYAMTLDGKAATRTGASKWVTGEIARRRVHEDRTAAAAIMVGAGTVLADDPMLDARGVEALQFELGVHQPVRIVCDGRLRTPLSSRVVATAHEHPTIIVTVEGHREEAPERPDRITAYREAGCQVVCVPADARGRVSLPHAMAALGELGINSIVVEGGPTLLGSLFDEGLIDHVQAYIAPKMFGGGAAPSPVGGLGIADPSSALVIQDAVTIALGDDILVEGTVAKHGEAPSIKGQDGELRSASGEASCSQA